jgi:3'-phosphoadenosine 5'-phosphosulfate sulfotransferase (PAPS reductase)/FAD synthetase
MSLSLTDIQQRQALPLGQKIAWSRERIREWYEAWDGKVYVADSGGADSTVLRHLVRQLYPDVPSVFVNTGLEFPEIVAFMKTISNVVWLKPKMPFVEVIRRYGYPVVSKAQACAISRYRNTKSEEQKYRRLHGWPNGTKGMISAKYQYLVHAPFKISDECCNMMKIGPIKKYIKDCGRCGMNGSMAGDSKKRRDQYMKFGCNSFNTKEPLSRPLSIWTKDDVWRCLRAGIPYSPIYDMGYDRTGCVFCMFGCQMEKEPRFVKLKQTHPKLHKYCMEYLGLKEVLEFMEIPYE